MKHVVVCLFVLLHTIFTVVAGDLQKELKQAIRTFELIKKLRKTPEDFSLYAAGKTNSDVHFVIYRSKINDCSYHMEVEVKVEDKGLGEVPCLKILCSLASRDPADALIIRNAQSERLASDAIKVGDSPKLKCVKLFNTDDPTASSD